MKPLVLIASCQQQVGMSIAAVTIGEYSTAVRLIGATPLIIPGGDPADILTLLEIADGILLTGSPSNVHPSHYDQEVLDPLMPYDPVRDAWSLPLIRRSLDLGIPLFAICRGFQEVNVALGGSLHQAVHDLPDKMDHRPVNVESLEAKYSLAHPVTVAEGGILEKWLNVDQFMVNSVHGQGIQRLAPGLKAEAFAPDGLIEAVTVPDAPGFNLAVQWHPEWNVANNPASRCILQQFGDACREHQISRRLGDKQPVYTDSV